MRDKLGPGTTLSYCTNVHPGSTLKQIRAQLEQHALEVKRRVSPDEELPVGLWLPYMPPKNGLWATIKDLWLVARNRESREHLDFKDWLSEVGLLPATCNAFPFSDFHQPVVKHLVYQPDWSQRARAIQTGSSYTLMNAIQPEHARGGIISTLPVGWRDDAHSERIAAAGSLLRSVAKMLWNQVDKLDKANFTLDLEPEPGCILDTADDVIAFFDEHLPGEIHRKHIGVCHDICHAAVMFEDQREVLRRYAEAGIRVNKVQISSALDVDVRTIGVDTAIEHLRHFAEPRYLHQTGFMTDGDFELIEDLPEAIERLEAGDSPDRLRVHFHVPIYLDSIGPLGTTNNQIAAAVAAAREYHDTKHFEVETYAWGVLPDDLKRETLAEGIADELKWVIDTCGHIS